MKIAFLQETLNQNMGIMYLSSALKSNGGVCELFVAPLEKNLINAVCAFKPDIIGFSVITGSHGWALSMAKYVKKVLPDALIIFGGPHPTFCPEILTDSSIDAVSIGEAERSFADLISKIEKKQDYTDALGFWIKKEGRIYRNEIAPLIEDISSLPYPDHGIYLKYSFYRKYTEVPFNIMRGCHFNCSFCCNHAKARMYQGGGEFVRIRSVDGIISEMEAVVKCYPDVRSIIIYDGIGGLGREWLSDFCEKYKSRIGIPWFTSIRADQVDDFLVEHVSRANCFCLSLGVETGDEILRERMLRKSIPNSQYVSAANLLHKAGIKVRTSNMLFLPDEDVDKAVKTVDLNREMKADFAWAYTLQPYPGTDIYDYAVTNGLISSTFNFNEIDPFALSKPIFKVKDAAKIMVIHRLFNFFVHNELTRRMLKMLIRIPPNPLFDAMYYLGLIASYAKYHQVNILLAVTVAWSNYRATKQKNFYCSS